METVGTSAHRIAWGGAGDRHRTGERPHLRRRGLLRRARRQAHGRCRRHRVRRAGRARRAGAGRAPLSGAGLVRGVPLGRPERRDRVRRDLPALRGSRDRADEHPVSPHRGAVRARADDLGSHRRRATAVVGLRRARRCARRDRARRLRAREGGRSAPGARARLRDALRAADRVLLHPRRPGARRLGALPDRREPARRRHDPVWRTHRASRGRPSPRGARLSRAPGRVGAHRRLRRRGCRRQRAHPHRVAAGRPHRHERARRALPGWHDRPRRDRAAGTHRAVQWAGLGLALAAAAVLAIPA